MNRAFVILGILALAVASINASRTPTGPGGVGVGEGEPDDVEQLYCSIHPTEANKCQPAERACLDDEECIFDKTYFTPGGEYAPCACR